MVVFLNLKLKMYHTQLLVCTHQIISTIKCNLRKQSIRNDKAICSLFARVFNEPAPQYSRIPEIMTFGFGVQSLWKISGGAAGHMRAHDLRRKEISTFLALPCYFISMCATVASTVVCEACNVIMIAALSTVAQLPGKYWKLRQTISCTLFMCKHGTWTWTRWN